MKSAILTGLLFMMFYSGISQTILLMENKRSLKNFKYYQGDYIILKVEGNNKKVFDEILEISDSSIDLYHSGKVEMSQITGIYKENWLVQTLRGLTFLGGIAYFGLDSFNRLINNDSPVILAETAIISGGLIAVSALLTPLRYRKFDTQKNWKLRMIDLNGY